MNDDSILGNALGQLGQTVKQGTKQVVRVPVELAEDALGQVGAKAEPNQNQKPQEQKSGFSSDEERKVFLKNLYGPSARSGQGKSEDASLSETKGQGDSAKSKDEEFEKEISDKNPEEQRRLRELRKLLHEQYYQQLVNPAKPKEERPAEKVEIEKKKEMQDLQQKEAKKPPPLAVVREQNKTEMFRGTAG